MQAYPNLGVSIATCSPSPQRGDKTTPAGHKPPLCKKGGQNHPQGLYNHPKGSKMAQKGLGVVLSTQWGWFDGHDQCVGLYYPPPSLKNSNLWLSPTGKRHCQFCNVNYKGR